MNQKSISFCQGKGSLTHNNRKFIAENVDIERMKNNIVFIQQPIAEAYEMLFAESTARYNARQKRSDRKIKTSYYESLFGCKPCNTVRTANDKRKSFYEDIVQIGTKDDSGFNTEDFQLVADCLKEYMAGFQKRNPNFHVFNAVLHMDEATPHLHIDYIPVGHYKRGQDTQNGIAQALKEMGFGDDKNAIARWRASEVKVIGKICREHGITPTEPQKSRGTLTIPEYKEQKLKTIELTEYNTQVELEIAEKKKQRAEILSYQPDYEKTYDLEREFQQMCDTLGGYLRNLLSAVKNREQIEKLCENMGKALMKSYNARYKAEQTYFEVLQTNNKFADENKSLREKNCSLSSKNNELYKEIRSLRACENMVDILARAFPTVYDELKRQQDRQYYSEKTAPKKKKSFELE